MRRLQAHAASRAAIPELVDQIARLAGPLQLSSSRLPPRLLPLPPRLFARRAGRERSSSASVTNGLRLACALSSGSSRLDDLGERRMQAMLHRAHHHDRHVRQQRLDGRALQPELFLLHADDMLQRFAILDQEIENALTFGARARDDRRSACWSGTGHSAARRTGRAGRSRPRGRWCAVPTASTSGCDRHSTQLRGVLFGQTDQRAQIGKHPAALRSAIIRNSFMGSLPVMSNGSTCPRYVGAAFVNAHSGTPHRRRKQWRCESRFICKCNGSRRGCDGADTIVNSKLQKCRDVAFQHIWAILLPATARLPRQALRRAVFQPRDVKITRLPP